MEAPKEGMIMESPSKDSIAIYRNSEWVIYHSASSIKDLASDQITALQSSLKEKEKECERYRQSVGRSGEDYLLEIERKNKYLEELKAEKERLEKEVEALKSNLYSKED